MSINIIRRPIRFDISLRLRTTISSYLGKRYLLIVLTLNLNYFCVFFGLPLLALFASTQLSAPSSWLLQVQGQAEALAHFKLLTQKLILASGCCQASSRAAEQLLEPSYWLLLPGSSWWLVCCCCPGFCHRLLLCI